jgi:hypothetical protein
MTNSLYRCDEPHTCRNCRFQILAFRQGRACSGLEGVIAPGDPLHADRLRESVRAYLLLGAERIAASLDDQERRAERFQMCGAQLRWLAGRVEGVTETENAARSDLVGDHRGHPPSERFPAEDETTPATQFGDDIAPAIEKHRLPIGCPTSLTATACGHVRELEPDDANLRRREPARDAIHHRTVHRSARTVGKDQRVARIRRAIDEEIAHGELQYAMHSRAVLVAFLVALLTMGAAPGPKRTAPDVLPHSVAMFLATLSGDGHNRITFKASALGRHFYFEEPAGVTVYFFDGTGYRKQIFMRGATLSAAIKKYKSQ